MKTARINLWSFLSEGNNANLRRKTMTPEQLKTASISSIAAFIKKDCKGKVPFGAVPYVAAMLTMEKITDNYGLDDGKSIVNYALCNLQSWKGENARNVKNELKKRAKW